MSKLIRHAKKRGTALFLAMHAYCDDPLGELSLKDQGVSPTRNAGLCFTHCSRTDFNTRVLELTTNSFAFSARSRIFLDNFVPVFPEKKVTMGPRVCQ
jgi:hypothetical protein